MNSERQRRQRREADRRARERRRRRVDRVDSSDWLEMILGPRRANSRRQISPIVYQGFRYGLIMLYLGTLLIVIGYHNPWVSFVRIVGLIMVGAGGLAVVLSVGHTALKYSALARLWNGARVDTELGSVSGRVDSAASKNSLPSYDAIVNADLPTYDEAILLEPQALIKAMEQANLDLNQTINTSQNNNIIMRPSSSNVAFETAITVASAGAAPNILTASIATTASNITTVTSATTISSTSASGLRCRDENCFIAEIELDDRRLESALVRTRTAVSTRIGTTASIFARSYSSSSFESDEEHVDEDQWSIDNASVVNNGIGEQGNTPKRNQGGNNEGDIEGNNEGNNGDNTEGNIEGNAYGNTEGNTEGNADGNTEGNTEGNNEGDNEGHHEDNTEGNNKGNADGNNEGNNGGNIEGNKNGRRNVGFNIALNRSDISQNGPIENQDSNGGNDTSISNYDSDIVEDIVTSTVPTLDLNSRLIGTEQVATSSSPSTVIYYSH